MTEPMTAPTIDKLMELADAYATCEFDPRTRGTHRQCKEALRSAIAAVVEDAQRYQLLRGLIVSSNLCGALGLDFQRYKRSPGLLGAAVYKDDASVDAAIESARATTQEPKS